MWYAFDSLFVRKDTSITSLIQEKSSIIKDILSKLHRNSNEYIVSGNYN